MEINDIIKPAVVVDTSTNFKDALAKMINEQTNTLLVTDEEGILVGEVGVSELLDAVVPEYLDGDSIAAHFATEDMFVTAVKEASDSIVEDFMNTDIEAVNTDDGLMSVAATAIAHQKGRIPVVDQDNHPVGIISRRGLKHLLASSLGIEEKK